jgi:TonB family protein
VQTKNVALALLLHGLLGGLLVELAPHVAAPRVSHVEIALVPPAARPLPPMRTARPSIEVSDHVSQGGGHGLRRTRVAAAATRTTVQPPIAASLADEGVEVPHGEAPGLDLASAGAGAGDGLGVGNGHGDLHASRRWPRPLDPPDHQKLPYSREALELGVSGTVTLLVLVGVDGGVHGVRVLHGVGHGLDQIAVEEARKLRFFPGLDEDGTPVAMPVKWTFDFAPP